MSDDIPFDKSFDLSPDKATEVAPQVRAIVANNPGPFTFKGTMSYIVGARQGRDRRSGPRRRCPCRRRCSTPCAARPSPISSSPIPTATIRRRVPKVKAATGAKVYAEGPHRAARPLHIGETRKLDAGGRHAISGPMSRSPTATWSKATAGPLEAITTPGHTANHMAFAWQGGAN